MQNIGYFSEVGAGPADFGNLREITPLNADSRFQPRGRPYFIRGELNAVPVIIKPYERRRERDLVESTRGAPFSLVMDANGTHVLERIAQGEPLEVEYAAGRIDAKQLGEAVGTLLRQLHYKEISLSHSLEDHLFLEDEIVKLTDLGESHKGTSEAYRDLVEAFEYLRDTTNQRGNQETQDAVRALLDAYMKDAPYRSRTFERAISFHLKIVQKLNPADPLIQILRELQESRLN